MMVKLFWEAAFRVNVAEINDEEVQPGRSQSLPSLLELSAGVA